MHFLFFFLLAFLLGCNQQKVDLKKVKVNEVELSYYLRGKGEPLLMIMGFRGTMAIWDPGLLELLEKKYTLILYDHRGAGLSSDTAQNNTTLEQMVKDASNLVKALGYEKVHVLGWSMGARIAMEMAILFPEVVNGLILCSPNAGGTHQAKQNSNAYDKTTSVDLKLEEGLSLIFTKKSAMGSFVYRLEKALLERSIPYDLKVSPQTIQRQVESFKYWDEDNHVYDQLPKIKSPTLVTSGLKDALDNPENAQIVASRIPFAWTAYFPDSGHYFLSQEYEAFGNLVILFLESATR